VCVTAMAQDRSTHNLNRGGSGGGAKRLSEVLLPTAMAWLQWLDPSHRRQRSRFTIDKPATYANHQKQNKATDADLARSILAVQAPGAHTASKASLHEQRPRGSVSQPLPTHKLRQLAWSYCQAQRRGKA